MGICRVINSGIGENMDRWKEYNNKTLTPPCVIQHDIIRDEHLIWVWDGVSIIGPLSTSDEDVAINIATTKPAEIEIIVDAKDERIKQLIEENTQLKSDIAVALDRVDVMEKQFIEIGKPIVIEEKINVT